MPGNGVGDRVHNFFAQENLPQGPRSQVDGNWASNDNLWVNSQKQFGVSDSSPRNFNPQQSETERGHSSQPIGDPHIFNISQTNTRPEFARNLSQSNHEQQNTNGYMYNRQQSFQTRPDEANFMGIDAEYGRNNVNVNPRGFYGSQQESVPEQQQPQKNPFRSESSEAPHGSFDLFGGQHQSNSQYPGLMQQQQQQQQSGFGDIQQLQQQLMLRKMQELQRQQEIQRQEQQNSLNQASLFARQQASGSHSHGLVNGTPTSEPSGYGWTEPAPANPNWLHQAAPGLHHPDQGQPQRSMGFVQQQVEPSLYGVPVSNSRNPINQYSNRSSFPGNNHNYGVIPEQHIVQSKGLFGNNTFGQGSNSGTKFDHMQQQNTVQESPAASDAASLDPDEEKILFGSDDNIWGAFGNSKNVTGGMSSLLDDNEFGNNLPSLQSGSWSALMQSAVAETTSTDVNVQEEWPDLNFQNPQLPAGKQHQNMPKMDNNITGLPHQHSSGGSNWLNHGASVPSQQTFQNYKQNQPSVPNLQPNNHHLNLWKHVDSSKGSENSDKSRNRLNKGSQISESSFNSSDKEDLKTHEMESSSKRENSNDSYRSGSSHLNNTVGPREMSSSDGGDSRTKQSLTSQTGRKTSGSRKFQYHPMGNLDEDAGMPFGTRQSVNMKGLSLQQSQGNFGHLKPSTQGYVAELDGVSKGSDDMRFKGMIPGHVPKMFSQHDRSAGLSTSDRASQPSQNMLDLLHKVDQSRERGTAKRINSTERNLSSEIPEPENSDGSFGGQQKSQSSNSQGIGLQLGPPSQRLPMTMLPVKPNSLSQTQASANQRGKGHAELSPFPHFQETSQGQTESQTAVHKMMTNFSAASGAGFPNARSQLQNHPPAGNDSFNGHISQIRQSSEGGGVSQSVTGENLSAASQPRGNSGVPQRSAFPKMLPNAWSNISQQPGPPPMFLADQARKSQLNFVESTSFGQQKVEEQEAEKSGSTVPKYGAAHGIITGENLSAASQPRGNSGVPQQSAFPKMLPNAWSNIGQQPGPPPMFLADQARKSQLNIVESTSFGQQKVEEQEAEKSGSENLSAASQPRGNSGVPQQSAFPKKLPNAWSNISQPAGPPPMFLADQARKSQLNYVESTSFGQQKVEEQEAEKSGSTIPKYGAAHGNITGEQSTKKVDQSQTVNGAPADNDSINPQKDLEAFGRTLKPSNFNQQYSLLNQMKAMRNAENDPNNRALKRLKDSDNMLTGQQVNIPTTGSLPASLPSKVAPAPDQNGSRSGINPSNIMNSSKIDISPQMAPSWFDQYGTFKTGQMLSQRADSVVKTGEQQPFNIGKISGNLETINNSKEKEVIPAADINQGGVILPSTELTVTTLDTNVVGVQNLAKKRKSSTAELHTWFKEVSGRFQNLQGICAASTEWCDQSNRLMEKVEDDGEIIKDIPRTKKRIILSTHLMQQLFPPPPATVLSTDAISSYESVAFYASRLALADSCNLVSNSRSNSVSDKSGESERTDDHHISEAVEDCFSKANKLENDFSRLNKRASILDLRVEYQDLEKFSIINRFAKFHGRGQTEGESSSVASANTPKPAPQRYVIAVALPKNLPERVQCMSL